MRLENGRIEIELHALSGGEGRALLLLHELFGSAAGWGEGFSSWPGPVWALDFAGHGDSQWLKGGAYTPEILASDVDTALRQIGSASLVGAGIGAYVALLVAAARRDHVPSVLMLPGAGLDGGGATPAFDRTPRLFTERAIPRADSDPMLCFLEGDVRPLDYTSVFARQAPRLAMLEDGAARPPWWECVRTEGREVIAVADLGAGLAAL